MHQFILIVFEFKHGVIDVLLGLICIGRYLLSVILYTQNNSHVFFSSLSTGLNSMAAVVLEDFWKPFFKKLSHRQTQVLVRAVVVVLGAICVGMKIYTLL